VLNPGAFSIKEHVLATILAAAAGGAPHGIDMVVAHHSPHLIYTPHVTFWSSLAWVAINQLIGFGVAGFLIRYLVKPVAMFWYANLTKGLVWCLDCRYLPLLMESPQKAIGFKDILFPD
jgi:hypothetical protein